jgi:hypothetical protein
LSEINEVGAPENLKTGKSERASAVVSVIKK